MRNVKRMVKAIRLSIKAGTAVAGLVFKLMK